MRDWILTVKVRLGSMLILYFLLFKITEAEGLEASKRKSSNKLEVEDLNFMLKSGIVLCSLIHKIYPQSEINVGTLQVRDVLVFPSLLIFLLLTSVWKSHYKEEEHFSVPGVGQCLRIA